MDMSLLVLCAYSSIPAAIAFATAGADILPLNAVGATRIRINTEFHAFNIHTSLHETLQWKNELVAEFFRNTNAKSQAREDSIMTNPNRIKSFLRRLESSASGKTDSWKVLRSREELHLPVYTRNQTWPGTNYMYLGHSRNLDHMLLGTEKEMQRRTCMSLLFEAKGNEYYCVRVDTALKFDGFTDVLSRFEREMLNRMPSHTMLGPAYDKNGDRILSAFAVWKALCEDKKGSRVLVGV